MLGSSATAGEPIRGTNRLLLFAAVAALLFGHGSTSRAVNLLLNPGFEDGTGADATDWEEFGGPSGSTSRSSIMPNSGDSHLYIEADHINNTPAAVAYFAQQVLTVGSIDNTLDYDLSFQAKVDSLDFDGIDMFYQIQWLDQDASDGGGVKGESLVPLIPAGISTNYQSFGLSEIDVPDGADSVLLRFQLSPGPIPDIANGLFIDDASLRVSGALPGLDGDYNSSGAVDAADYAVWRDNVGAAAGTLANDPDGGVIGEAQYQTWVSNYGAATPQSGTAIPEPTAAALGLAGLAAGWLRRGR